MTCPPVVQWGVPFLVVDKMLMVDDDETFPSTGVAAISGGGRRGSHDVQTHGGMLKGRARRRQVSTAIMRTIAIVDRCILFLKNFEHHREIKRLFSLLIATPIKGM